MQLREFNKSKILTKKILKNRWVEITIPIRNKVYEIIRKLNGITYNNHRDIYSYVDEIWDIVRSDDLKNKLKQILPCGCLGEPAKEIELKEKLINFLRNNIDFF